MTGEHSVEHVVVTGSTGFIGQHLLSHLLADRATRVEAIGRDADAPAAIVSLGGRVRWWQSEVDDCERLTAILNQNRPGVLFHLAAAVGGRDVTTSARVNVAGTAAVLEAALRAGVGRVVLAGTAQEYGPLPSPLSEDVRVEPSTVYGVTKAAATHLARVLQRERGAPVVILRPFNVYGPGQLPPMFIADAVRAALCGEAFRMSSGEQRRDFVFVKDVVRGFLAAGKAPRIDGCTINLASGQGTPVGSVAETIWRLTGTSAPLLIGAVEAGEQDRTDSWASVDEARRLLNWEATTPLEAGLLATIDSVR